MAYEFKDISTVELVETADDTANVLIEEGGTIKKVPKTEVGGGNKCDMVISIVKDTFSISNHELYPEDVTITNGSIDDLMSILKEGNMPVVKVLHNLSYDNAQGACAEEYTCCYVSYYQDEYDHSYYYIELYYLNIEGVSKMILMKLDGVDRVTYYMLGEKTYSYHSVGSQFEIS